MSNTDPEVLFEELSDEVPDYEAEADCGETPIELMELSIELQKAEVSPAEFMEAFGQKAPKKKGKK